MLMPRDIEVMRWILEQKFMTEDQIQRVFWKDVSEGTRNVCRRLNVMQKEGYLKRSKKGIYRHVLYLVTAGGIKQVKALGRNPGLGEMHDVDYSMYRHDIAVTDLRILFHELGYREWLSERILTQRNEFRRLADGMIYHRWKYFAVEYESSQK